MIHTWHVWQEISVFEITNAEEDKRGRQKNAVCGDRNEQRTGGGLAFPPRRKGDNEWPLWDSGDCTTVTGTWIWESVYLAEQCNSHDFKRSGVAVNCWGQQWSTWQPAIRILWNGVLKAEHQRVASASASTCLGCKWKGKLSLLGVGQWAISMATPTLMENYHHP